MFLSALSIIYLLINHKSTLENIFHTLKISSTLFNTGQNVTVKLIMKMGLQFYHTNLDLSISCHKKLIKNDTCKVLCEHREIASGYLS